MFSLFPFTDEEAALRGDPWPGSTAGQGRARVLQPHPYLGRHEESGLRPGVGTAPGPACPVGQVVCLKEGWPAPWCQGSHRAQMRCAGRCGGCRGWSLLMAHVDLGYECNNFSLEKNRKFWDFPGGPAARTLCPNAGGPGSIPGRGARSRMLQPRPSITK